eukprot:TRINITY_DN15278_c0_g1_i1.p1 TRINITY_DN15278_c0_g1~~TRINITY_DN15278_c0_g1_i1.p1  ORF type:complete len:249 (+),score=26.10 TRINITY_DN15278_c0_g1_i1:26-772(+)
MNSSSEEDEPKPAPVAVKKSEFRKRNMTNEVAPPLDFSFKEVKTLAGLIDESPRGGYRKPKPPPKEEPNDEEKSAAAELRALAAAATATGNRKEDAERKPTQQPEKKVIKKPRGVTTALKLCNNQIPNLEGWHTVTEALLEDPSRLTWLDLSFNQLETIDPVLLEHKLTALYLHANNITSIKEVDKLSKLPLRTLTLHGNPIENVKEYRSYVIARIPTLRTLDFTAITNRDRQKAETIKGWFKKQQRR